MDFATVLVVEFYRCSGVCIDLSGGFVAAAVGGSRAIGLSAGECGGRSGLGAKTRNTDDWGKVVLGGRSDGIWDDRLEHPVVFLSWGTQVSHG